MKTVVYGTGGAARMLMESHGTELGDVVFASTDGGGEFLGQPVMSVEELAQSGERNIIIASVYVSSILARFRELGISTEEVQWYYHEERRIVSNNELSIMNLTEKDVLYAFYDLAMNPSTYDATVFAVRADVYRRQAGKKVIHFVIVPSLLVGGRAGDFERYGGEEGIKWRQSYVVQSVFKLLPATASVSALTCRDELSQWQKEDRAVFPRHYDFVEATDEHSLKDACDDFSKGMDPRVLVAPKQATRFVEQYLSHFLNGRKLLTVTMREYGYQSERSTNVDAWADFFSRLDSKEYMVIVVRDTNHMMEELPEQFQRFDFVQDFPVACTDVNFRMALYEMAYLNLTVTTGPSTLLYFTLLPYIQFKTYIPSIVSSAETFHELRTGARVGEPFPLENWNQKWFWYEDSSENIWSEFNKMVEKLESRRGLL